MKKFLLPLLVLLIGISSCSEDFEVAAPYKQITVVYGLLDVGQSAQYIRVQKAFMDENKSAIVMAKDADSSYYDSVRVEMREITGTGVTTFPALNRVDLQAEGYRKDDGSFFTSPSYAYKVTQRIQAGRRYRLVITNTVTGRVDSAETEVIDSSRTAIQITQIDFQFGFKINFARQAGSFGVQFNNNAFPAQAKMLEAVMRFHVIERNIASGAESERILDYTFARTDTSDQQDFLRPSGANAGFYSFLASELGPAPAGIERRLDSPDVIIYLGTRDLLRYQIFNNASGGLTGDQIRPIYTNIQSRDGSALGLFAARTTRVALEVPLDVMVIDSLRANPQTVGLNIVGLANR